MTIIILKNKGSFDVPISDVDMENGIILAGGTRNLTNTNQIFEIQSSQDLRSAIASGSVYLSIDGVDKNENESLLALNSPIVSMSGILTPIFFNAYLSATQTAFSAATTVSIDTIRLQGPSSAFSLSSNEVTVNIGAGLGIYKVCYNVTADNAGSARTKARWWLEADTGSGFAEVAGTRRSTYHRNGTQGEDSCAATAHLQLNVGHKVRIRGDSISGSSVEPLANGVSLTIERIGG